MTTDSAPARLKTAAILQLASGVVNVFVMAAVSTTVWTLVGGGLGTFCLHTLMCPVGMFGWACGAWGLLLLPIGVLEIVAGAAGLVAPDGAALPMRAATWAELFSVLCGGIASGVVGVLALSALRDDEVVAWLEAHG